MPMSRIRNAPHAPSPGRRYGPSFGRPSISVISAGSPAGSNRPVSASAPVGTSIAITGGGEDAVASLTAPRMPDSGRSIGRTRPVPSTPSTMTSASRATADRCARSPSPCADAIWTPASAASTRLGSSSGREVHMYAETRAPHHARWRATTKPSPPLLPGPTRTRALRPDGERSTSRTDSATARPAFSIKVSSETPACTEACSIRRIPSEVTIFMFRRSRCPKGPSIP